MNEKRSMKVRGEDAAAAYLERVGICVVEREYTCDEGSVDIIGFEGDTLVFVDVEVRTKSVKSDGWSVRKSSRIRRVAECYVQQHDLEDRELRFDAITILVICEDRALLRHHRSIV